MSDEKLEASVPPSASELQLTRTTDFRHLSSNQSRVRVGNGEIGLTFSYLEEISGIAHMTDLVSITVSPAHAKRIAVTLTEILKQYEANIGAIAPMPSIPIDLQLVMRNVREVLGRGEAQENGDKPG